MNKKKTLEYCQELFIAEIFTQGMCLLAFLVSPIKLVSLTNSIIYILLYIAIYKVVIKKSNMKVLLILNVLLNIVPAIYMYLKICIYYNPSLTKMSPIIFTLLVILTIIMSYKYTQVKKSTGKAGKGWVYAIAFFVSQLVYYYLEPYTIAMIVYVIGVFIVIRFPLLCYQLYRKNEEYVLL